MSRWAMERWDLTSSNSHSEMRSGISSIWSGHHALGQRLKCFFHSFAGLGAGAENYVSRVLQVFEGLFRDVPVLLQICLVQKEQKRDRTYFRSHPSLYRLGNFEGFTPGDIDHQEIS